MSETVIIAIISFLGTLLGAFSAANITKYRINQLEKKVEHHNHIVERTYKIEGQIVEIQHDIRDIKTGAYKNG